MCGIAPGLNAPDFFSYTLKLSAYDVKPITARQCIKLLPIIAKSKPSLKHDILSALHKANISFYDDSMQSLVYKDIQKALKEIQKL
uniref:hypothetical protein n=1 Tax=Enterocloster clostridioformis TaxID=1531 RepID=UPI000AEB41BB